MILSSCQASFQLAGIFDGVPFRVVIEIDKHVEMIVQVLSNSFGFPLQGICGIASGVALTMKTQVPEFPRFSSAFKRQLQRAFSERVLRGLPSRLRLQAADAVLISCILLVFWLLKVSFPCRNIEKEKKTADKPG